MTSADSSRIDAVIARHKDLPGALLPMLHGVQDELGFIPAEAVVSMALALNLSRAEVHGVVTYYHHFRTQPAGRHVLQICRAEACQAMGSEPLWAHACQHLATDGQQPTQDGAFTLEPVYCLGLCASSPTLAINGKVHARVSIEKFNALVDHARLSV